MALSDRDTTLEDGYPSFGRLNVSAAIHLAAQFTCNVFERQQENQGLTGGDCVAAMYIIVERDGVALRLAMQQAMQRCEIFATEHKRNDAAIVCIQYAGYNIFNDELLSASR